VALVGSSIKIKPCCHLANIQRMHIVSVCLQFGNIIWLPWQRPLTNLLISYGTDLSSAHNALSYGEKIAKSVQYIQRYSTKYASFLATSYPMFTNEPCQLWSYWTAFHEIFTRYTGIICTMMPSKLYTKFCHAFLVFFCFWISVTGNHASKK